MISWGLLYLSIVLSKGFVSGSFVPYGWQSRLPVQQCSPSAVEHETTLSSPATMVEFHEPSTRFETFGEGVDVPASFIQESLQATAVTILQDKLGLRDGEVVYNSGYSSEIADYAYLKQSLNGIPFVNAVANIVLKNSKLISLGSSFVNVDGVYVASSTPHITTQQAVHTAERAYLGRYNHHPTKLEYYVQSDGSVALVHVIQIQNDNTDVWVEAYVDAHSGKVLGSANFIAESGYNVVPIERQSILDGSLFLSDPEDKHASPHGWHKTETDVIKETAGNNVIAFIKNQANTSKPSEGDSTYKYKYDTSVGPTEGSNQDAARTNAFYIINSVHDFTYRYGFNEQAFNFQQNNFGKGGEGDDRVLMMVQNDEGYNNAKFGTPPDGQSGTCKMYLWNSAKPYRDGDLDNSVIVHEMGHGLSNRLTGGGTAKCLQSLESKGMGEGWSDIVADWTEQTSAFTQDFTIGRYATGKAGGTRFYPYSTDPQVNPFKYSDLNTLGAYGQHGVGQVWANILHNVYAALVNKHGYSSTARTNPDGKEGNVVFFHLFVDGLAGQPCYPKFTDARDAWIQADKLRYNGENKCLLWKVFASRGLGMNAKSENGQKYTDGFEVPSDCKDA